MQKLSIILNYGCSFKCHYCIWSNHKMIDNKSTSSIFDFNLLRKLIESKKFHKQVSISGGGDPLFNHKKDSDQRRLLLKIIEMLRKNDNTISLHTRFRDIDSLILENIDQIVTSYDDLHENGYKKFLQEISKNKLKVRMAKVAVSKNYDYIRDCIFAKEKDFQITYYPNNKNPDLWFKNLIRKINHKYEKLMLITRGDQKIYFQPNNKIYEDYAATKEYIGM